MWHLFKNSDNKYEVAFIKKGKYIVGTRQGYEKKKAALKAAMIAGGCDDRYSLRLWIQDDTLGIVLQVDTDSYGREFKVKASNEKPGKPFKPTLHPESL
jgi:hypothetical protein